MFMYEYNLCTGIAGPCQVQDQNPLSRPFYSTKNPILSFSKVMQRNVLVSITTVQNETAGLLQNSMALNGLEKSGNFDTKTCVFLFVCIW